VTAVLGDCLLQLFDVIFRPGPETNSKTCCIVTVYF
jgi:hypothetical protein